MVAAETIFTIFKIVLIVSALVFIFSFFGPRLEGGVCRAVFDGALHSLYDTVTKVEKGEITEEKSITIDVPSCLWGDGGLYYNEKSGELIMQYKSKMREFGYGMATGFFSGAGCYFITFGFAATFPPAALVTGIGCAIAGGILSYKAADSFGWNIVEMPLPKPPANAVFINFEEGKLKGGNTYEISIRPKDGRIEVENEGQAKE